MDKSEYVNYVSRKLLKRKQTRKGKNQMWSCEMGEKLKQNLGQCVPQALNRLSTAAPPYAKESRKTKV